MSKSKPQKRFRNFIFDSSIPGGVRVVMMAYMVLILYFSIVSIFLSVLIFFNPQAASEGLLFIMWYSLGCLFFLLLSIYPLWSARFAPRFLSSFTALLIIGYGAVWFFVEIMFTPLAFAFLLIGAINLLYITKGQGPDQYYKNTPSKS
ncbi:MAG: hypothetical protein ACQEP6_00010 [Patescibacteria group bacterium]